MLFDFTSFSLVMGDARAKCEIEPLAFYRTSMSSDLPHLGWQLIAHTLLSLTQQSSFPRFLIDQQAINVDVWTGSLIETSQHRVFFNCQNFAVQIQRSNSSDKSEIRKQDIRDNELRVSGRASGIRWLTGTSFKVKETVKVYSIWRQQFIVLKQQKMQVTEHIFRR